MNTHVKFELAKLLKEKGFDEITSYNYSEVYGFTQNMNSLKHSDGNNRFVSAPTISEVVMWLHKKHNLWINVYQYKDHTTNTNNSFVFKSNVTGNKKYKSPTKAYDVAINYVVKNLI